MALAVAKQERVYRSIRLKMLRGGASEANMEELEKAYRAILHAASPKRRLIDVVSAPMEGRMELARVSALIAETLGPESCLEGGDAEAEALHRSLKEIIDASARRAWRATC